MNYIKLFAKEIVRHLRNLKRDVDDLSASDTYSSNLKINTDSTVEIDIDFPSNITSLRFDIGLSHNAPNSAQWLLDNPCLQVIGIEANRFNVNKLVRNGIWSKNIPGKPIKPYKSDRFNILYCAIDDVSEPCFQTFFNVRGDPGTSSLLEPTEVLLKGHKYSIKSKSQVPTVPLSLIMQKIPWSRFEFIELCKIDTQGKDLDVLKSAKEYLNKIALVSTEVETFGQYKNAAKKKDIYDFMETNGFIEIKTLSNVDNEVMDVLFANPLYLERVKEIINTL